MSVPMDDHPCARVVDVDVSLDEDDADYAHLVHWVMRHSKCGTYCLRPHKTTKKMVCRFKYPFDVLDKSHIVEDPPDSGMYRFMGHRNDSYVCSHNRRVLQTWRANIDWSPILSLLIVVNYIGKYAAKAEPASKNFTNALQEILDDLLRPCKNAKSVIKKLLMRSVCERDVSAQEVCHLLMGYALCQSSRRIVLLNVSENSLLASTIRRSRGENDEEIFGTDPSFVDRYLKRPSEHGKRSLLHMAMKHYYSAGCWHKYQVDAVVRVVLYIDDNIPENSEKWELFCRQQVLLHHHYRSLEEAKGGFKDWSQQYINLGLEANNFCMVPDPLDDDVDDVDAAFDLEDAMWEEWMMAASMHPMFESGVGVKLGFRDMDTSYDWSKGLDRYPNIEIEKKFIQNHLCGCQDLDDEIPTSILVVQLDQLSNEQLAAHNYVINSFQDETSIKLIVCGGAGTGKSTLVNSIVQSVTNSFGKHSVRIMAPTGVAAFNIGGATVHHELAINPEQRPSQPYKPLSNEQCQRMQESFKGTKLIIIDEYNMVGRAMLSNIDLRCCDIFSDKAPFGNISIVLVGDMRQLSPVFDSPLYVKGGTQMQKCGGIAYAGFEKCVRLSQIFRQVGDEQATFRDALQRLSDGSSTEADWHLFKTRDASTLGKKDMDKFRNALRLFPTRKKADQYNLERLLELQKPVAHIPANNNCEAASNALQDEAKGLEKVVCLAIGARVMLRSNLSTQYGLVNGAMGTVDDIVYASGCDSKADMPLAVMVNFDNYSGSKLYGETNTIPISPQTCHWKSSSGTTCQRTQMPIILCWEITIHKSQGLTLERAVVDIGEKESLGLTFVALSHTRKLCDLAFSPMFNYERLNKIKASRGLSARLEEEKRLYSMSKMEQM